MLNSQKLIVSKSVSFAKSDTTVSKTEKVEPSILFVLLGLNPEYFGNFETSNMENLSSAETDIPIHLLEQELEVFENDNDDKSQLQNPMDAYTHYPGLQRSTRSTAKIPAERFHCAAGLVSSVSRSDGHITIPSSYSEAINFDQK